MTSTHRRTTKLPTLHGPRLQSRGSSRSPGFAIWCSDRPMPDPPRLDSPSRGPRDPRIRLPRQITSNISMRGGRHARSTASTTMRTRSFNPRRTPARSRRRRCADPRCCSGRALRLEVLISARTQASWVRSKRPPGSPQMTYGRGLKKAMNYMGIAHSSWHELAQDRDAWRAAISPPDTTLPST